MPGEVPDRTEFLAFPADWGSPDMGHLSYFHLTTLGKKRLERQDHVNVYMVQAALVTYVTGQVYIEGKCRAESQSVSYNG